MLIDRVMIFGESSFTLCYEVFLWGDRHFFYSEDTFCRVRGIFPLGKDSIIQPFISRSVGPWREEGVHLKGNLRD